jgi:hypothetical protein
MSQVTPQKQAPSLTARQQALEQARAAKAYLKQQKKDTAAAKKAAAKKKEFLF